jgi:ABC-type dipeptide/oligopeptide/nickel transport system permease component
VWRYVLRRVLGAALTALGVSFFAYVALTLAPGDAAEVLIGEHGSSEQIASLRRDLHLDAPLLQRYGGYMLAIVTRGDLGRSLISGRAVHELLLERLPPTLLLAFTAVGLATAAGGALGILAALRRGTRLDVFAMGSVTLGLALPPYWVALLLVLFFSVQLRWFPVFGAGTPAHLVLPAITLALPGIAIVARLVRASILEVSGADFVRTALAKGLRPWQLLLHHVLPNSLIPALTLLGLHLSHLLGGAFVVETIFAWPGLGRLTVQAVYDRDFPVLMGAVLVVAPLCLGVSLLVDLLHGALDPRVRHEAL